jgi:glycosyltransferase involved in cell wall biosynthesis
MRIVYLLESAAELWGGVKSVLEDANLLSDRGHQVLVLTRSGAPTWMRLRCELKTVPNFQPDHVPEADVLVATWWPTVPAVHNARKGAPVHYCQGYEGGNPEMAEHKAAIDAAYRLPTYKITISSHLTRTLRERYGCEAREIVYCVDDSVMYPGESRIGSLPVRVGLVGPYLIEWKGIVTGLDACALAARAGLDLQLVRITNHELQPQERDLPFRVEYHVQVAPERMGDLYRSMNVFLGTSVGAEEGFFLPAVEAMACGVPCVLTDIPCHRGHGEPNYALFVPSRNPREMAQALIVASTKDLGMRLRAGGLEVAGRYQRKAHLDQLERAFAEIAADHRRQSLAAAPRLAPSVLAAATAAPVAAPALPPVDVDAISRTIVATLLHVAELHSVHGDHQRALDHLEAAVRVCPDDSGLWRSLAQARRRVGDQAGARLALERVVQLQGTAQ